MRQLPAIIATAALLGGCATYTPGEDDAGPRRPAPQAREQTEYLGVVEGVREVEIPSQRTGVAPAAGAVIGGTIGAEVGRGRGSAAGVVVGTVIGGVAGEAAAQAGTEKGVEITVRLDEGRVIAVTQPAGETFKPGDRVRVLSDRRTARVTKKSASGEQ